VPRNRKEDLDQKLAMGCQKKVLIDWLRKAARKSSKAPPNKEEMKGSDFE